ncbi:MAG: SAM-dependent methyltransferase [Burkholderiaceae bacterium]|nr:SAM-dependent methyltransferase [Burkholderiaceae bacterium]
MDWIGLLAVIDGKQPLCWLAATVITIKENMDSDPKLTQHDENAAILAHRSLVMNRRVRRLSSLIAEIIPMGASTLLDVGAGSGEMALAVSRFRPELAVSGVDVFVRPKTFIPVAEYDGTRLPFDDDSIDVVMTVDVLHHCDDPVAVLRECARVASKWVVIKDHVCDSAYDRVMLRFMDWVGNRAHGVVLPYNYLSSSGWDAAFEQAGLRSVQHSRKLAIYPMPFDLVFGGTLHCLHLLEKR